MPGYDGSVAPKVTMYSRRSCGLCDEARAAITPEMIDLVTIIGPLEECRARLAELAGVGVIEAALTIQVPDNDPARVLEALEGLAPAGTTVP